MQHVRQNKKVVRILSKVELIAFLTILAVQFYTLVVPIASSLSLSDMLVAGYEFVYKDKIKVEQMHISIVESPVHDIALSDRSTGLAPREVPAQEENLVVLNSYEVVNKTMERREEIRKAEEAARIEAERRAAEERARIEAERLRRTPREKYTRHMDLGTGYKKVTVEELQCIMNIYAREKGYDYGLMGTAEYFVEAGEITGLNPIYLFAHAAWESGWGDSAMAKNKKNYYGIAAFDRNPSKAYVMGNDKRSGIINGAIWIKDNFYDNNQKTLHDMIYNKHYYASAADDWINGILAIMNKHANAYTLK